MTGKNYTIEADASKQPKRRELKDLNLMDRFLFADFPEEPTGDSLENATA